MFVGDDQVCEVISLELLPEHSNFDCFRFHSHQSVRKMSVIAIFRHLTTNSFGTFPDRQPPQDVIE